MKVTIAQLQERIKFLEIQRDNLLDENRTLKKEASVRERIDEARIGERQEQTDRQITNLREVIRWQINPETAKYPFMPTKSERDENRYR